MFVRQPCKGVALTVWQSAGHEVAVEQAHSSSSDTFKWCGTEYSCADLKAATDLLMHSDNQSQSEDVAQPSTDPWDVASFKVFIPDAVQLLNALADRRALPEVSMCELLSSCVSLLDLSASQHKPLKWQICNIAA